MSEFFAEIDAYMRLVGTIFLLVGVGIFLIWVIWRT